MRKPKSITVKAGTANEFMAHVKNIMRAADEGKFIQPSYTLYQCAQELEKDEKLKEEMISWDSEFGGDRLDVEDI